MTEFAKYLTGVKAKMGIKSDNQLSIKLGVSQSAVQSWSVGGRVPEDDTCIKIASLSGDDPSQVILLAHKVKATDAAKPYWDKIFKTCAAAVLVFVLMLPLLLPYPAEGSLAFDTMYIMSNQR